MLKRKIYGNVIQKLSNIPLKRKLLLSYFIIIFIPLSLLTAVTYKVVFDGYKNQILFSATQSFDQAYDFLNYKVNTLINGSDIVHFNNDIQTILAQDRLHYENDVIQQNIDYSKLSAFFNNLENSSDIYRVSLYVPDWFSWSSENIHFHSIDEFKKTSDYQTLLKSTDKVLWLPPRSVREANGNTAKVITLLRKIRNKDRLDSYIGIAGVSTLEENFKKVIVKSNSSPNGVVYLQNSEGAIVCASNDLFIEKYKLDASLPKQVKTLQNPSWNLFHIGSHTYYVFTKKIKGTDWNMVSAIPSADILAQSNRIRNIMFALMVFIGFAAYIAAFFISRASTDRIHLLIAKMELVQQGNLDVQLMQKSNDEIGKLFEKFNYMIHKIKTLVAEQYAIGKEIKSSELKALQAQINPHFLYNTLDLINWKAMDTGSVEIAEITQSLAKFYKLSLNKGKAVVSIEDEIRHVSVYVQIQNMRFDNRINLIVAVDEAIYQYSIIKIVLQPIVENSILHGILENKRAVGGTIKICGYIELDTIIISVQDDGVGMDQTTLDQVLSGDLKTKSSGYGLKNINNRLQLTYGEQYGISFESVVGSGTTVKITIPAVPYKEDASILHT